MFGCEPRKQLILSSFFRSGNCHLVSVSATADYNTGAAAREANVAGIPSRPGDRLHNCRHAALRDAVVLIGGVADRAVAVAGQCR
jgi:hypothetical protein